MKKKYVMSLMIILTFLGLSLMSSWSKASTVPQVNNAEVKAIPEYTYNLPNPGNINFSYVFNYSYLPIIKKDRSYTWKVEKVEKTSSFHIAEGDKKIKTGDRIHVKISADVSKDLPHPENWALIYVNDVRSGFSDRESNVLAIWKYILPAYVNITSDGYFYQLIPITDFLSNEENWIIADSTLTYSYNYTDANTDLSLRMIYDKSLLLLNELHMSVKIVKDGYTYGANVTLIRLHGWGLPYYTSTLVVWIPLGTLFVLLIIALRLRLFQKIKLYFEARKLAQRE